MPEEGQISEGMADAYRELEQKIVAKQTLRQLEDYIECLDLPEDERDALSLWVWAEIEVGSAPARLIQKGAASPHYLLRCSGLTLRSRGVVSPLVSR